MNTLGYIQTQFANARAEIEKLGPDVTPISITFGPNDSLTYIEPGQYCGLIATSNNTLPPDSFVIGYQNRSIMSTHGVDLTLDAIGRASYSASEVTAFRRTRMSNLYGHWCAEIDAQDDGACYWRAWLELEAACARAVEAAREVFALPAQYHSLEVRHFSLFPAPRGRRREEQVTAKFTLSRKWADQEMPRDRPGMAWITRLGEDPRLNSGIYLHPRLRKQIGL